jgi:hypothetical protein
MKSDEKNSSKRGNNESPEVIVVVVRRKASFGVELFTEPTYWEMLTSVLNLEHYI